MTIGRSCAAIFALCTLVACQGRPRSSPTPSASSSGFSKSPSAEKPKTSGPAVAVIDLTSGLPEQAPKSLLASVRKPSFDELVRELERIDGDKKVKGLWIRFGSASMGFARATELGDILQSISKSKPVHCHAEGLSNATYYAARGCTKLVLAPSGQLETVGIGAQVVYLRKLLVDHLGIQVDMLQVGKFKGAEEPLTRDGPSAEARESLEGTLADLRGSWLDAIAERRPKARETLEDGPYTPERALALGLIDQVAYADDAKEIVRTETGAVRDEVRFGPGAVQKQDELGAVVRLLAGGGPKAAPVALVRAIGNIVMVPSGGPLGGSQAISEKEFGRVLSKLEHDDDVKAVVIRIDSPGGSALASDLLWHGLMRVRAKKPVVFSVGEMAASGGYYMASTGSLIVAEPTSILGSIGVVGGKLAVGPALEKVGVHAETFSARKDEGAARRAAYLSLLTAWDDPTRIRVREVMVGIYNLFLERIVEGRGGKLTREALLNSAEGRIFSGRQAKERGLVDELGGLRHAVGRARELAGLPANARVAGFGSTGSFLEALGGDNEDTDEARAKQVVDTAMGPPAWQSVLGPEVPAFVGALSPLAQGEHFLVALPFALVVR